MEAFALVAADSTASVPTTHDPDDTTATADHFTRSRCELRQLTDLAERYARRLVVTADPPAGVLLLVEHDDLVIVALDGPDPDVRTLPRLVAKHDASSAAVVVAAQGALGGVDGGVVHVVGETVDGLRDERRFRVRPCGHTRRLTRLVYHNVSESPCAVPRLFSPPVHAV